MASPEPDKAIPAADLPQRYITLPAGTQFVESLAHNPLVAATSAFVPVTSADPAVAGLYEVEIERGTCTRVCALDPGGNYVGSKLSDTGVCFICVDNRATILAVDLNEAHPRARVIAQLPEGIEPNDLDLDQAGRRLFIAANDQRFSPLTARGQTLNTLQIHGWPGGSLWQASMDGEGTPRLVADDLGLLAGIAYLPKARKVWLSQLASLAYLDPERPGERGVLSPHDPRLFADNLRVDGDELLFPFYRKVPSLVVEVMHRPWASRMLYRVARWLPERAFGGTPPPGQAADRFDDVCWGHYDTNTGVLRSLRLIPTNPNFDGHCTHVERVRASLVFVNYLASELLVVDAG